MTRQKSLGERYVAALEMRGLRVVRRGDARVKVERTPAHDGAPATYYYVGPRSLRFGTTTVASRPCNDRFKAALLGETR